MATEELNDAGKVQQKPTMQGPGVNVLETLKGKVPVEIYAQLEERVALGIKKYGMSLQTNNNRDALLDCLQEALDGIMYSQQAYLEEKDSGLLLDLFVRLVRIINSKRRAGPNHELGV